MVGTLSPLFVLITSPILLVLLVPCVIAAVVPLAKSNSPAAGLVTVPINPLASPVL